MRLTLAVALLCAVLPSAATAQIVPSATYVNNLPQTCDDGTPRTRCTLATPVVGPDGIPVGSAARNGAATIATGQIAVTTSATQIVPARTGNAQGVGARKRLILSATSAVVWYVGAAGITSATGLYVAAAAGSSVTLQTTGAVFAVGASAVTISYVEEY